MVKGDRVIAISHHVAGRLIDDYGLDPARLRVIQRGVDLGLFDPERVTAERLVRLVERWRVPDGVPVVMLPARVTQRKGHALLVEALARLERGSFHCLMVGEYGGRRSEEHTSELQSLMRISYAVFCLKKKKNSNTKKRRSLQ